MRRNVSPEEPFPGAVPLSLVGCSSLYYAEPLHSLGRSGNLGIVVVRTSMISKRLLTLVRPERQVLCILPFLRPGQVVVPGHRLVGFVQTFVQIRLVDKVHFIDDTVSIV